MLLRVFVCLLLIAWVVVQNIMDFVDLYEGAERIFPDVVGGKYQYERIDFLQYSAVFTSSLFLPVITMCVYPSCKQWQLVVFFVEIVYIVIYILLYFVVKAKRKRVEERTVSLIDNNYVVIKVVKGKSETQIADKEIYDVFLKDDAGNIITIKAIDADYYKEKMLTGEKIKISKKRHPSGLY